MVIDKNVSRLETRGWAKAIEHIREFLNGTTEIAFSHPADESTRRRFVATVLRRYGYFRLRRILGKRQTRDCAVRQAAKVEAV